MNLRKLFLPLCSVALCLQSYAQDKSFLKDMLWYIDNPSVFEKGQEEGHAWHMPEKSMLLNGTWKFFWCDTPEGIPAHFFNPEFPDKQWGDIKVPSNWEMQGYGDKLFRNVSAPFGVNPPHAPKEYNPTGLYRRTFKVPASWAAKDQIFLRFEKVASASFVWVNGHEVGYNEGAQEPAEYNITPYLKPGENTLAVCVLKYSDGYYLEGQDYWRLAGIFDDVWLYATPAVRIFDWQVITEFDNTYTDSQLSIQVKIKDYQKKPSENYGLKAYLKDKNGKIICYFSSPFLIAEYAECFAVSFLVDHIHAFYIQVSSTFLGQNESFSGPVVTFNVECVYTVVQFSVFFAGNSYGVGLTCLTCTG